MTAPLLYAPISDLRLILNGTDNGVGTAAQLSDDQLTLAMMAGTNRVSAYVGGTFDGSTPQADPANVPLLHDLALDLAAFWATKTYMKHKTMGQDDPVVIAYRDAMKLLEDIRDGRVRFDPATPGGIGDEVGIVINRIPNIFSDQDSNVALDPLTGGLEASSPDWMFAPGMTPGQGSVYQG